MDERVGWLVGWLIDTYVRGKSGFSLEHHPVEQKVDSPPTTKHPTVSHSPAVFCYHYEHTQQLLLLL